VALDKGLFIAGGALAAAPAIVVALMVVTTRPAPTATEAFASHVCADMLRAGGYEAGWYQSRESDGPTQITVNSIDVTGDNAVANVRFVAANHSDARTLNVDFLREGDQWKACRYAAGQSL
jgi:hypothetical protein